MRVNYEYNGGTAREKCKCQGTSRIWGFPRGEYEDVCLLEYQGDGPDDGGRKDLRNAGKHLPGYTLPQPSSLEDKFLDVLNQKFLLGLQCEVFEHSAALAFEAEKERTVHNFCLCP